MKDFRIQALIGEALSPDNRWHCGCFRGEKIEDEDVLMAYFINYGGIKDFDRRYKQAMSETNRWYCSQMYGHHIDDPEILWTYYMDHRREASDESRQRETVRC